MKLTKRLSAPVAYVGVPYGCTATPIDRCQAKSGTYRFNGLCISRPPQSNMTVANPAQNARRFPRP